MSHGRSDVWMYEKIPYRTYRIQNVGCLMLRTYATQQFAKNIHQGRHAVQRRALRRSACHHTSTPLYAACTPGRLCVCLQLGACVVDLCIHDEPHVHTHLADGSAYISMHASLICVSTTTHAPPLRNRMQQPNRWC